MGPKSSYPSPDMKRAVLMAYFCSIIGVIGSTWDELPENISTTFTMINRCPYTIWPAIDAGNLYISKTNFGVEQGGSETVEVSHITDSAIDSVKVHVWGRTNCTRNSSGSLSCVTGDCGRQNPVCNVTNVAQLATVADFIIRSGDVLSYGPKSGFNTYDVRLLHGFNLPLLVVPMESGTQNATIDQCSTAGCDMDLNPICPVGLQMTDDRGNTLGCRVPCDGFPAGSCNIPYPLSTVFQKACPRANTNGGVTDYTKDIDCTDSDYLISFCQTNISAPLTATSLSTMKPRDFLFYPLKLVSGGGRFVLGFFTMHNTNLTYVGIWHAADTEQRTVWIANVYSPVTSIAKDQLQLVMDSNGTLKTSNGGNDVMIAFDHVRTNNKTTAVLEDSGNFVLKDSENGSQILWQSFDSPASVLLPGMKLGFNRTTGENYTLSSWLSSYNPASGAFTLSLEQIQGSGQLVIRRRGNIYWTSGPWEHQSFRHFPSLNNRSATFHHKLNLISESDAMFFSFETTGSNVSMLELSPDGEIIDHANGRIPITPYDHSFCYGYERDNGCWASKQPECRGKDNKFEMKSGDFVGIFTTSEDADSNVSLSDCMNRCWNDCTCNGFSVYSDMDSTGCRTWFGNHTFQVDLSGKSRRLYVLLTADILSSSQGSRKWIWGVVFGSIAMLILLLVLGLFSYVKIRNRKEKENERRNQQGIIDALAETDVFENVDEMIITGKDRRGMKMFSIASVMAATNGFLPENKLGEGGFGSVYKGVLVDGREIAVKRLSRTSRQGLVEFKNELMLIFKLQHRNLVRVVGCCIHDIERMIIYEYMPNKSLDFFLFDQERKGELDWKKRLNIIEGVAQGFLYLHQFCRMAVIHRDLKASNILLDENMNPKIADFGLARMFKHNETEAVTRRVIGTCGYMSPEYLREGIFSTKSDVFSFGVLVLEIISGRKNSHFFKFDDYSVKLVGYAWDLWKAGETIKLKDPALGDSVNANQLLRCIHIGLLCVQERAVNRPTMLGIISMLENETIDLPAPREPGILMVADEHDSNRLISVNGLSISELEPR